MGNAKSRHKPSVANENSANVISNCKRIQKTAGGRPEEQKFRKSTTTIASAAKYNKTEYQHSLAADDGQQQQQRRLKQSSVWSLGSLNWNLSFSGRNSLKQQSHNKSIRRSSFTAIQQRRSKTQWHKPLTNTIFSTHFKDTSRNKELHIEQLVAKGAYGVVFKVIDKEHRNQNKKQYIDNNIDDVLLPNGTYALKVLKKSKIIAENSVQQIKNEVDIQKVCGHYPFIVRQIDIWQNRHNLHILSEYVPNGELFSKICTFSLDLIRLYLAEIALALDFLHNAGIIYRDAKSENILLTHDYHLKLTDFGLSKWLRLGFTTKTMCGTLQYMAPEILQGLPYGHSADWWSLGVIVCQMFMDKTPDISTYIISSEQLIDSKLNANEDSLRNILPSEVEHLPHEGKDVLKRLLDLNPQNRLRSVRALQKIAMYKNFKINPDFVLNINPLDIIANDNIMICDDNQREESALADKAFRNF